MQQKCSSPGDRPKEVRPLLFGSDPEPTRPESCDERHLKLLRAEVQIPGGERSECCKRGVMNRLLLWPVLTP